MKICCDTCQSYLEQEQEQETVVIVGPSGEGHLVSCFTLVTP
jgi:hypothetical protein